ncbi:MAG: T9SS type A sorting domain-containing protein [Bacteroidota bacterium]
MKKNIMITCISVLCMAQINAQETFKVMFYNLLNYPNEDVIPNREQYLETVLSDYQPDLFLVCELNDETGANTVLSITRTSISSDYNMATYASNTSDDDGSDQNLLQNLLYYDSSKFILESETIVSTDLRDFNVYVLRLNTTDQATNPIRLYTIVCHLKAGSDVDDVQRRFEMVQELQTYLETLPSDSYVLLGGDLNLKTATESAFQELLDITNNITFADPPNRIGSWNNNTTFIDVFTQSTRTQSGLGGASGGFDDRFDFILTSENMLTTADITYVDDSYVVYGNNGNVSCFNEAINSFDCAGPTFSFAIRDALHNFSDHLPVTLSLETDATLLSTEAFEVSNQLLLKENIIDSELTVLTSSFKLHNQTMVIYNTMGQLVKTLNTGTQSEWTVNVSELSSGLYFLAIPSLNINPVKFIIAD